MGNKEAFIDLLNKYLSNDITAEEEQAFLKMVNDHADDPVLEDLMWESYQQSGTTRYWNETYRNLFADRILKRVTGTDQQAPAPVISIKPKKRRYMVAAAVAVLIATGAYLWLQQKTGEVQPVPPAVAENGIMPGREGAILTLDDGRKLLLDSLGNGVVADEKGTKVLLDKGRLSYDDARNSNIETAWNTMITPRGRQFQLILPDGSKVWLNAASAIRYPTSFTGKQRLVELDGEAYFEIEKNAEKPFRVKVNDGSEVEVLGTRFNINAYENETAVATTLLEGAVRVNAFSRSLLLAPRQQATVDRNDRLLVKTDVDINKVMAWKNGYFDFNHEELPLVLRQVERWYDIQVKYEGEMPNVTFRGKMDRNVQLADVINSLKNLGVETRLEQRTLVIVGKER